MTDDIVLINLPERCCRNCKSFIRVRDTPTSDNHTIYDRVVLRKGFCILGQKYGVASGCDFSLYYNDTNPHCNSYVYDQYNAESTETERKFRDWYKKLITNSIDRRTKEYRLLDEYRKSLDRPDLTAQKPTSLFGVPIKDKSFSEALYRIGEDRIIELVTELYISSVAREQLHILNYRKAMPYKEYDKVLGYVRFKLAEEYQNAIESTAE